MPTSNTLVRVATYCRVSTSEQAENGTSIENQTEQLHAYCKAQGWEIAQEYVDAGFSGKDDHRPDLQRMTADAKAGLFTKIIVYKLDRLYRNLRLLLGLKEDLTKANVILISMRESIDTSGMTGRMTFQVLGMVSEWERESIADRMKSGRLQRYRQGCWAGGYAAYGYAYNKLTKKLEIDESEAVIVRRIFNEYKSGKSLYAIANGLNAVDVKPRGKNGLRWRASAVRLTIMNPMFMGKQILNRKMGIAHIKDIDESKTIIVKVPAIISEKVWKAAQRHLEANKHIRPQKKEPWLLQGMVFCGECGRGYRTEKNHQLKYYLCRGTLKTNHLDGSPRCTQKRLRAGELEDMVWNKIVEISKDSDQLLKLVEDTISSLENKEKELLARVQPIETRLKEIAEKKMKLADAWMKATLGEEKFRVLQRDLDLEEARLKAISNTDNGVQLEELEHVRNILNFWRRQEQGLEWDLTDENGNMIKRNEGAHNRAISLFENGDHDLSNYMAFPCTRRDLYEKMQLRLVVYPDRIESPQFKIYLTEHQKCPSDC